MRGMVSLSDMAPCRHHSSGKGSARSAGGGASCVLTTLETEAEMKERRMGSVSQRLGG